MGTGRGIGSQFLFLTWRWTSSESFFFKRCQKTQLQSVTLRTRATQDSGSKPQGASGSHGYYPILHIKWQGNKKVAPHRSTMLLCPSRGDFNKGTESNEIWSDVYSSVFLLCLLTIYRGVAAHGPVLLNDIWSVPLSEKIRFISLAYIYIILLRKSLQLKLSQ